ncbi:hypothetical protein TRVA0_006S00320 [Trichomonascus vanleenenianus]|uniref:Cmg1p n=1 Tax=Trichomonascus vanleenenianus TaxID=2268995 RepID=UPI003ECB1F29
MPPLGYKQNPPKGEASSDEHEEDYMNMSFEGVVENEPLPKQLADSPIDTKYEKINQALKTSILPAKRQANDEEAEEEEENRGLKLLRKMGYKPGSRLGSAKPDKTAINEPVVLEIKPGRHGIGAERAMKKELLEAQDEHSRKQEAEKSDFREHIREQHETKRTLGRLKAAQKVLLNIEHLDDHPYEFTDLSELNVLYRGLVAENQAKQRLAELKKGFLGESLQTTVSDDHEDAELGEFEELLPEERLQKVLDFLRQHHYYCFWCSAKYVDEADLLEHCPGEDEEDH